MRLARYWGDKPAGKPKIGRADFVGIAATAVNHDRGSAAQARGQCGEPSECRNFGASGIHNQHLAWTHRRNEATDGELTTGESLERTCNLPRRDGITRKPSTATALGETGHNPVIANSSSASDHVLVAIRSQRDSE
jgi:hypothetical protein